MRTLQSKIGAFQKVGECLYRYSSNGVYYARIKSGGKGDPPQSGNDRSRYRATRAGAFQRRAATDRSLTGQNHSGGILRAISQDDPTSEAENRFAKDTNCSTHQSGLACGVTDAGC